MNWILYLLIYLYASVMESLCKECISFLSTSTKKFNFFVVSTVRESVDDLLADYSQIIASCYDMKNHFRFQAK
jgi:hypothetical protein